MMRKNEIKIRAHSLVVSDLPKVLNCVKLLVACRGELFVVIAQLAS